MSASLGQDDKQNKRPQYQNVNLTGVLASSKPAGPGGALALGRFVQLRVS